MRKMLIRSSEILLLLMVIVGLYTILMTVIGQTMMSFQANGSVVESNQRIVGSKLLARPLSDNKNLWGRSMVITVDKDGVLQPGTTNISPKNKHYQQELRRLKKEILKRNPDAKGPVPQELLTTSGSGMDPDISLTAAVWQAPRIAEARHLHLSSVIKVINSQASSVIDRVLGEQTVNVLQVNQKLNHSTD
ncbi:MULTISPECIES: potassium-transporting ATPase subunit C [Lactobacillaceae]|uniref:potassium-transporting ATPase subunit C n=1 Tax=Lactobacillaceae TaxID=33958 RepID=UPI0018999248|nr:potassium-transporting ATPase subunit C [Lacticaseibacillus paracasei]MCP9305336.1 potassium-transporting ATPase subunit C [Lacticaseibacillus paracasei]MCP9311012.1 potassium-transporting ATPase subunit C [Lacticaseibacillus paracasei]MCP9347633.1 potassium-transporting ATPase subunit C [Lacticaseibacillus paracasei]MCP9367257.1 potassium-transporting ATPase subunit C [Lacticaseibacillus paracasei]MCP9379810.1 potassium-transporting ATPase subunit C [Lacticaseibacillus paracasei]